MLKPNTNLASEYFVLSALYRQGFDAYLTLGNKKGLDIVVATPDARVVTVEVKGVMGKDDWPADNIKIFDNPQHIYAFVSFDGEMPNPTVTPSVWIIPSPRLDPKVFRKKWGDRAFFTRPLIKKHGREFRNNWPLIAEAMK